MENDLDLGIGQRNRCEGMQWFGEHDMGQEAIRYGKWDESRRPESEVRNIGDQRSEIRGPVGQLSQKKGGWTVESKEFRELQAVVWAGEAGTGGRRYLEHNSEGHGQEDDRQMMTGGEVTTNRRKKSKLEEEGQRELA
ncbi:hypothetical protein B0H14DRAFT_2615918 [Mycena olivaceomarginata]|nr:hypothetical protein B0H14DRAFT_2615918 [Mycena olivaceomarginata]